MNVEEVTKGERIKKERDGDKEIQSSSDERGHEKERFI